MRILMACAAAVLAVGAGCDRSNPSAPLKPVGITLDPHQRNCSVEMAGLGPDSPPGDSVGTGALQATGVPGEWSTGITIFSKDRHKNPEIVMRFYDGERKSVRVEVRFTGTPTRRLKSIVFPHVSRSERFRLKMASGESDYSGHSQVGEDLHLRWPESGDGTVTFLAWPHVH